MRWASRKRDRHAGLHHCLHCGGDFEIERMEPLYLTEPSDPRKATHCGPSNCCKQCWAAFVARHPFMSRPSNIEHV